MTATTTVAIYGAVVATGGFGWQVWAHAQRRRTRVQLSVRHRIEPYSNPDCERHFINVAATNVGETPEYVVAIGFAGVGAAAGWEERWTNTPLAPNGIVVSEAVALDELDFDVAKGITPYVELASHGRIDGPVESVMG